jgi:hypothetical protein
MTVVLPQRSYSSFIDHPCSKCKLYNGEYLSIVFLNYLSWFMSHSSPSKCGIMFVAIISKTIQNSCEWGNFDYLLHPYDYVMQNKVISQFVWEYIFLIPLQKLNRVLLLSVLLQVMLACHSYHEVRLQLPFVLKRILG